MILNFLIFLIVYAEAINVANLPFRFYSPELSNTTTEEITAVVGVGNYLLFLPKNAADKKTCKRTHVNVLEFSPVPKYNVWNQGDFELYEDVSYDYSFMFANMGDYLVYGGGCFCNYTVNSNIFLFNPKTRKSITHTNVLHTGGIGAAVSNDNNLVVFAGGANNNINTIISTSELVYNRAVDIYNHTSQTWLHFKEGLSQPRMNLGICLLDSIVLFAGGEIGKQHTTGSLKIGSNIVDIYNFVSSTWSTTLLTISLDNTACSTVNKKAVFVGSNNGVSNRIVTLYNAISNKWFALPWDGGNNVVLKLFLVSTLNSIYVASQVGNKIWIFDEPSSRIILYPSAYFGSLKPTKFPQGELVIPHSTGCEFFSKCPFNKVFLAGRCTCLPGTVEIDIGCQACAAGYFSNETNVCSPQVCSAGNYPSNSGLTSAAPSQIACSNCRSGTYSSDDATSCSFCTLGHYSNSTGLTTPYCLGQCAAGYYCNFGSTSMYQFQCPAGTYSKSGAYFCEICPAGTYSNAASSFCLNCPSGRSSYAGVCDGPSQFSVNPSIVTEDQSTKTFVSDHCLFSKNKCDHEYSEVPLNRSDYVNLVFVIPQKNLHLLTEMLMDISEPESPNYGKHLSHSEVTAKFHNSEFANKVESWIKMEADNLSLRVDSILNTGNFVVSLVPVPLANKLLDTNFVAFQTKNIVSGSIIYRAPHYRIHSHVSMYISEVLDVLYFPLESIPQIKYYDSSSNSKLSNVVDLNLLNSYYNIDSNDGFGVSQGIYSSFPLNEFYNEADLSFFCNKSGISNQAFFVNLKLDAGTGNDPGVCTSGGCMESMLDIEYITGISQNSNTTFWLSNAIGRSVWTDFIVSVSSNPQPPSVISISYVSNEDVVQNTNIFNVEAQKLGLRGVTLVASSGDYGANNLAHSMGTYACAFSPSNIFPSSSPFVVSVGGTQGPESGTEEVGCSSATGGVITSGGGFSSLFPRPTYQSAAVVDYQLKQKSKHYPPLSNFPSGGRATPDVSLLAFNYEIILNSKKSAVSGTSASAPAFAGMLSLINAARKNAGLPALGFVNPALYYFSKHQPQVFKDIVHGDNSFNGSCPYGYSADVGWDAMTGLGSVDFLKLKEAFLTIPSPTTPEPTTPKNPKEPNSTYLIVGLSLGIFVLLLLGLFYYYRFYKTRTVEAEEEGTESTLQLYKQLI